MYFHIQHLTNIKATLKTNKYLSSIIKNEEIIQKNANVWFDCFYWLEFLW